MLILYLEQKWIILFIDLWPYVLFNLQGPNLNT